MPDSYTSFLNLVKPEAGGSPNTWGTKANSNYDALDTWAGGVDALAKAALPKTGGTITGTLFVRASAGTGYVTMQSGGDARSGFIEFLNKDNVRHGYIGYGNGTTIDIFSEKGVWNFLGGVPTINGKPIYYADNLDLSSRVAKTGDTMTGTLTVNGAPVVVANGYFDNVIGNVARWRQIVDGSKNHIFRDGDSGDNKIYFGWDGSIWTKQFGDLNNRIESRGAAYRDAATNASVTGIRWVYAGDLGNEWSVNGGFQTPYNGAAIVDRATGAGNQGASTYYVHTFRWRYLQAYVGASGGWVATGYAS